MVQLNYVLMNLKHKANKARLWTASQPQLATLGSRRNMEIFIIFKASLDSLNKVKSSLYLALLLPFIVYAGLNAADYLELSPGVELLISLIECIVGALVAITVHRILLIGTGSTPKLGTSTISKREVSYLVY